MPLRCTVANDGRGCRYFLNGTATPSITWDL